MKLTSLFRVEIPPSYFASNDSSTLPIGNHAEFFLSGSNSNIYYDLKSELIMV